MSVSAAAAEAAGKRSSGGGQIPSLDGLRALSIALVLIGHVSATRGMTRIDLKVGDYGHLGVVVFFVISGFLITRLLLTEHAKKGRISLRLFYARRALRLFPASYAFIACVAVLWLAGVAELKPRDLWHAVTYTVNYQTDRSWEIGHLWSLSVEEQFYLLWPFTVLALGPRRAIWAAGWVILLGPAARALAWLWLRGTPYRDLEMFPMVADSLATGCVLAKASGWLEGQDWYRKLFHPACSAGILAALLALNRYMGYTVVSVFGSSAINIGIAILVHRSVCRPHDWVGKALNWKPVAFVGTLSYSLYLWQQLFLNRNSDAWVNAFPQNLALVAAAALASYFLLEKPLLELRHRLRP